MEKVLEVCDLYKDYHNKKVLENISFSVYKGEFLAILGQNGVGKTTLIESILGLKKVDNGRTNILGFDPVKNRKELFEKVGVQFQEESYQSKILVKELCEVTRSYYKDTLEIDELLEKFYLLDKKEQLVSTLSGGERQRLFIVLALLHHPELVILDELTTGLDTKARRNVWKILKEFKKQNITGIIVSHYMDEVEALCDRIIILKDKRIIFEGSPKEVIKVSPYDTLENAYLWHVGEVVE